MGRVINTNSPAKQRNQARRTIAEILRHLSQKQEMDAPAKDMAATLVYSLREIYKTIDSSATAWEKRDYWMKADEFRRNWDWSNQIALELEAALTHEKWEKMPEILLKLLPHFTDIKIAKFTRDETAWKGAYQQLMLELS